MKQQKGFTLIELLVVIVIIGVLSGIVIVGVGDAIQRARMARGQVFSRTIHSRIGMDLSGWWSFENNALDRSGWRNDGTIMDGAVVHPAPVFEPGVFGNALRFDGVNDFVNVGGAINLRPDNLTAELWLKPFGWVDLDTGWSSHHFFGTSDGFGITTGSTTWGWWIRTAAGRQIRSLSHGNQLNRWHHLVLIYNRSSGNMKFYWNGVLVDTHNLGAETPIAWIEGVLRIGHGGDFTTNGLIDEPRIYRAAMPTSYIQKRYVQGIKGLASNGGITQEEKKERIAVLRNSDHLAIDLDSVLTGNIDFSQYTKYLVFEK